MIYFSICPPMEDAAPEAALDLRRFVCIFAFGENRCSHQFLNWWQQLSTGQLHFAGSNLSYKSTNGKRRPEGGISFWWT